MLSRSRTAEHDCARYSKKGTMLSEVRASVGTEGVQMPAEEIMSEVLNREQLLARAQDLTDLITLIEHIAGDDFCEILDWDGPHKEPLKTAHEKLSAIYRFAHSARVEAVCFARHEDWRKEADEAIAAMKADQ